MILELVRRSLLTSRDVRVQLHVMLRAIERSYLHGQIRKDQRLALEIIRSERREKCGFQGHLVVDFDCEDALRAGVLKRDLAGGLYISWRSHPRECFAIDAYQACPAYVLASNLGSALNFVCYMKHWGSRILPKGWPLPGEVSTVTAIASGRKPCTQVWTLDR